MMQTAQNELTLTSTTPFPMHKPHKVDKVNEVELIYTRPRIETMKKVKSSNDAYEILKTQYPVSRIDYKEMSYALFLNRANNVLASAQLSIGGLSGTIIDIREVFQLALRLNAVQIILSHNHPSGNLTPSQQDKALTKGILEAGKILNIVLTDHLIISSEGYYSFADEGAL